MNIEKEDKMKDLGIYVHIPFCKQKCFYCDFVSYANKINLAEEYICALEKEIENSGIYYWRKEELPWELLFVYVDARRSMTLNIFLTYAYGLQSKI